MKNIYFTLILLLGFSIGFAQNNGILFNGTSESLEIPNKPEYNIQASYTIEAWIYANEWKSLSWQGSIITKDAQGPNRGFAFRAGDNGKLSFAMAADGIWPEVLTPSIMNLQQWHHVAVVVNNGGMTLYVDGQAAANSTYSGTLNTNDDLPVTVGGSSGFADRYFDGIIDEIRIWNLARTATEIADNTTTEFTGSESGLIAYFPMNDGSGTTATNLVDAACSATLLDMDDTNWVDGYTIPEFDVGIQGITNIDIVNLKTRPILVSTEVQNLGSNNISGIDLTFQIDGSDVITETVSQTILPGEKITYTFATPIDLTEATDPELTVIATHPDDENMQNNSKSITLSTQAGNIIRLFDAEVHNFGADGQSQSSSVVLPGNLYTYSQLLLHIDVACPSGGCDPWDQTGKVVATTDEGSFEIARYITPYGIACGPWTVDVTDFKNVLAGPVTFESFIQVWGSSGWATTIDLELVEGADPTPFTKVNPLWQTDYWVYGDPGINDDLAPVEINVASITESSHIRMTISGHGQGNTNNAAEFYNVNHQFQLNGSMLNNHNLWKDDCAANSCADQAGNWLFPRAGWCPGQQVEPYIVNTTGDIAAGSTVYLDYDLQDYENLLNTGYNGSSHTEPHYRIHSYYIEESSQRYEDYLNLVSDAITPTISGMDANETLDALTITISNDGSQPLSDFEVSYFINNTWVATETVNATLAPGESMDYNFTTIDGFLPGFQNIFYGVVAHPMDESIGDNVSQTLIDGMTDTDDFEILEEDITIFPNPATGGFYIEMNPSLLGSQIEVINTNGQIIKNEILRNTTSNFTLIENGIYFLRFTHPDGYVANRKLIVIK